MSTQEDEKKCKRAEYQARWRANNKDRVKATSVAYYAKYQDEERAYSAAYRAAHMGRVDAYAKKYRVENAVKVKTSIAAWRAANPARIRHHRHKRRAMLRGSDPVNDPSIIVWDRVWRGKVRVRCFWCEGLFHPRRCHADHITPLSKGGLHRIDNLCISCGTCNMRKRNKDLKVWNQEVASPVLL